MTHSPSSSVNEVQLLQIINLPRHKFSNFILDPIFFRYAKITEQNFTSWKSRFAMNYMKKNVSIKGNSSAVEICRKRRYRRRERKRVDARLCWTQWDLIHIESLWAHAEMMPVKDLIVLILIRYPLAFLSYPIKYLFSFHCAPTWCDRTSQHFPLLFHSSTLTSENVVR